ncbi:MAG: VanZ family protein [Candidatus Polarisedimenticolia bacterium]|nr:VanZ family protein [bacterium]
MSAPDAAGEAVAARPSRRWWRFLLPIAGMALDAWSSNRALSIDLSHGLDKVVHGAAFGALAAAWFWAFAPRLRSLWAAAAAGVALTALWGAADEMHQKFVPGRSSDVADFAADLLGALVAAAAVLLLSRAPLVRRLLAPRAARTE